MNYFTADTHFGHKLMVEKRPFETMEEHDTTIIDNINDICLAGDVLYIIGDIAFGDLDSYVKRIKPQIHLVTGNHDHKKTRKYPFAWSGYYKKCKEPRAILCHFPMVAWDCSHYGSYMLHGHCHGAYVDKTKRILDVGVDTHDFKPWSVEEIIAELEPRPYRSHHESDS